MTPLILAAGMQYTEVVDLLLRDERVDPWRHYHGYDAEDVDIYSALPVVFSYGHVEPEIRRGIHRRRMAQLRGMVRAKVAFRRSARQRGPSIWSRSTCFLLSGPSLKSSLLLL